jgi:Caspase domain
MRLLGWILSAAILSMVAGVQSADAQSRVALVIGNGAYHHASKLTNPRNDAADLGQVLRKYGFHVLEGFDLGKPATESKLREFARALAAKEVGLFFYAGHGLQVSGKNYLVPVDAKLDDSSGLDFELVPFDLVQRTMERETSTNILFLDACRDNPLAGNLARTMGTRSLDIGRGLAQAQAGVGTLISFSTQPGNVALDGAGRNSPFAGALVAHLAAARHDLSAILIDVRNDVMRATHDKQVPWEHSALRGRFYFGADTAMPAGPAATAPAPSLSPAQLREREASQAWERIKDTTSVGALEAFVRRFGDTFYGDLAKARIPELRQAETEAAQRRAREAAEKDRAEKARYIQEWRKANGGCDPPLRRQCMTVGPTGGGPTQSLGCVCSR